METDNFIVLHMSEGLKLYFYTFLKKNLYKNLKILCFSFNSGFEINKKSHYLF